VYLDVNLLANEVPFADNFTLFPYIDHIPEIPGFVSVPHSLVHSVLNRKRNDLRSLSLNCDMTADIFSLICTCKELRYLFVCDTIRDGPPISLLPLANLTNLETLQLVGFRDVYCSFPRVVFDGIVFPHLKKLEIVQGGNLLESMLLPLLAVCPKLNHLNIQDNILTDEMLCNIKFCKELEYLDVSRNYSLTDKFLKIIADSCRKLKFLDIAFCPAIGENFVHVLRPCQKLEVLRLAGFFYSGAYFHLIPFSLPNLKEFYVKHYLHVNILQALLAKMPNLRIIR
jgi:hypothetical protein